MEETGFDKVERERLKITKDTKKIRIVYFILGVLEVSLGFRLIFKILGANPGSRFVSIIYSITDFFVSPFVGIFKLAFSNGIETRSILEPTVLIAMAVYAILAWGIFKLIKINSKSDKIDRI